MAFTRFFLAHRQATTSVSTVSFQLPINLLYESTMENQFFRCTLHIFSYIVHLNDQKFIFIISAQRKQPLLRIVFDLCHIIHHHKVRSYFLCCKLHSWHQKLIHKTKFRVPSLIAAFSGQVQTIKRLIFLFYYFNGHHDLDCIIASTKRNGFNKKECALLSTFVGSDGNAL